MIRPSTQEFAVSAGSVGDAKEPWEKFDDFVNSTAAAVIGASVVGVDGQPGAEERQHLAESIVLVRFLLRWYTSLGA